MDVHPTSCTVLGIVKTCPEEYKEIKDQRKKKSLRFIISQYLHCISRVLANPP